MLFRSPHCVWLSSAILLVCILGDSVLHAESGSASTKAQIERYAAETAGIELDVQALRDAKGVDAKRDEAVKILSELLDHGPLILAQHALTFLSYAPNTSLVATVRKLEERIKDEKEDWCIKHLRLSIQHYLLMTGDSSCKEFLLNCLEDDDPAVRARVFQMVRNGQLRGDTDAVKNKVCTILEKASEHDLNTTARLAATSAWIVLQKVDARKEALHRLQVAAAFAKGRERNRAVIELCWLEAKLGQKGEFIDSDIARNLLLQLAESGQHDEQMFALELLVHAGDLEAETILRGFGDSDDYKKRLTSAFYVLLSGDRAEAFRRLSSERNSFVQMALVSVFVQGGN